jgi:hypothetical protein
VTEGSEVNEAEMDCPAPLGTVAAQGQLDLKGLPVLLEDQEVKSVLVASKVLVANVVSKG